MTAGIGPLDAQQISLKRLLGREVDGHGERRALPQEAAPYDLGRNCEEQFIDQTSREEGTEECWPAFMEEQVDPVLTVQHRRDIVGP